MDRQEAGELLARRIDELRRLPYGELLQFLDNPVATDLTNAQGRRYSLETQVFWDDKRGENLRVIVSIDDGGWSAFAPMTDDFIKTSEDRFVGE